MTERTPSLLRRGGGWLLLGGFVLALVATLWTWHRYTTYLDSELPLEAPRLLVIEEGLGASAIVDKLVAEGLVDSPNLLRLYLWRSGLGRELKAGSYRLEPGLSVRELVDELVDGGRNDALVLVIASGSNLWEIGASVEAAAVAEAAAFVRAAQSAQTAAELGVPASNLEGYLAPGRYEIARNLGVPALLKLLHARFLATWSELVAAHPTVVEQARQELRLGDHELITLASLVQKEAVIDAERAVVARVFYNRLRRGMKLQSDPTCVYPPQKPGERPSPARCREVGSRYSTYVIAGLPPGPICAPSAESLRAVLEPYDGPGAAELLYFVARADGSWRHYFSRSLEEHEQAVDHYLRKTRPQPPRGTVQP